MFYFLNIDVLVFIYNALFKLNFCYLENYYKYKS